MNYEPEPFDRVGAFLAGAIVALLLVVLASQVWHAHQPQHLQNINYQPQETTTP